MLSTVTLAMADGVKVNVQDSLDLITPYVLREQEDWFEDEIKFLRRLLEPGQKAIDIGANHGLYTLTIAKAVGPTGHVWAFEPASATAQLLAESIAINGYGHVTLEQSALSDSEGTAQLSLNDYSELNALVRDAGTEQSTEEVRTVTLDGYAKTSGWQDIDLVKIDAEGEEANVLKGGARFFAENSPLVQYEIKAGKDIYLDLVHAFAEYGYDSYRLVPGHDILVPFRSDTPTDRYLLNLFACKPDRAARLMSGGWLVDNIPDLGSLDTLPDGISQDALLGASPFGWRASIATMPYGRKLAALWEQNIAGGKISTVEESLALYALSRDSSRSAKERFCALDCSFRRFKNLGDTAPTHLRLASLARIARDYGARSVAISALRRLWASIMKEQKVILDEPFLAPGERFDSVDPGENFSDWILAATAEELERSLAFSSFYTGGATQERLEMICSSGFAGPEMHRRLDLVRQRFGTMDSAE